MTESRCPALPLRHGGRLLGKGARSALWVAAEEPACLHVDHAGLAALLSGMKPPVPIVDRGKKTI